MAVSVPISAPAPQRPHRELIDHLKRSIVGIHERERHQSLGRRPPARVMFREQLPVTQPVLDEAARFTE